MKNPLAAVYEQVLINEAEKSKLENPSNDTVGNIDAKQDLFGSKPKPVEGAAKTDADKPKSGPTYKNDVGSTVKPDKSRAAGSFKGSAPAKDPKIDDETEVKDTEVDVPSDEDKSKKIKKENLHMNAFEALFKKTLTEEEITDFDSPEPEALEDEVLDDESDDVLDVDDESVEESDEEGDLLSDLRELQDKISSIITSLEGSLEEEPIEELEDEEFTDEDYTDEFETDVTEEPVKEGLEKPKILASSKGKKLTSKGNKVGKIKPKGGKASAGTLKHEPKPKALGDKKKALQTGGTVKSSIAKGEFIK